MSQARPTYDCATGKSEGPIVKTLVEKYGPRAISWPISLSLKGIPTAYIYERNEKNGINAQGDVRPTSKSNLPQYFLDYTAEPRVIVPASGELARFLSSSHRSSYEFIVQEDLGYSTIDLDYVWNDGLRFRGFELTTFWVEFRTAAEANRLISMINRRPSWRGPNGAQALHRIVDAADDLNIEYLMVCANTVSKVGTELKVDGNVLHFLLNHQQVERLSAGHGPDGATFCSFQEFLRQL